MPDVSIKLAAKVLWAHAKLLNQISSLFILLAWLIYELLSHFSHYPIRPWLSDHLALSIGIGLFIYFVPCNLYATRKLLIQGINGYQICLIAEPTSEKLGKTT